MHVIAAKAVCFQEALQPSFREYQAQVVKNCQALAQGLLRRGVRLVSGGTYNHLLLVDLRETGVTGKALEAMLDEVNITCNKNAIPNDPQSPMVTSGVRLGTAAVTSRGMVEQDMDQIAKAIAIVLQKPEETAAAKALVEELRPLPLERLIFNLGTLKEGPPLWGGPFVFPLVKAGGKQVAFWRRSVRRPAGRELSSGTGHWQSPQSAPPSPGYASGSAPPHKLPRLPLPRRSAVPARRTGG